MKKLLSILLTLSIFICSFLITGTVASAAESKYDEQKQQFNSLNSNFNYSGDKFVYFAYNGSKNELRSASKLGKKGKLIAKLDFGSNVNIKGKYIYYINYSNCSLYRCKTDGSAKKAIVKVNPDYQSLNYIISGKKIIYRLASFDTKTFELKSNDFYTCSLSGKNKKKIIKSSDMEESYTSSYYTYKNKLYFKNKGKLCSYNFKTRKTATLKKGFDKCYINSMEGENIYYFTSKYNDNEVSEIFTVYRFNVSTKKKKKITSFSAEEPLFSMVTTNGKVFISTGTGAGNSFAEIKKGKPEYDSYHDKYTLGGETLGYYNKYVVMPKVKVSSNGSLIPYGFVKMAKTV